MQIMTITMNTIQIHIIVCVGIFYGMYNSFAQNIGGIINHYTEVKDIDPRCWRKIIVKSSSGFSVGDKVFIIQMQGVLMDTSNTSLYGTVTNYNNVGNSEFGRITGIARDTISLYSSLTQSYSMAGKVQLIRVPEYDNATITSELNCKAWDGTTGGVLVLYARGTVTMKADINVSGMGYRRGVAVSSSNFPSYYVSDYKTHGNLPGYSSARGEGISGQGDMPFLNGRGSAASGGGGGGNHNTGGAGGSNGGCGGNGSYGWVSTNYSGDNKTAQSLGGKTIDYTVHRTLLGGGGGAGHSNQNDLGHGGNGGGIVIVVATSLINTGSYSISADGFAGKESIVDGGGGGGAGGTIYLNITDNPTSTHILSVKGGKGGDNLYTRSDHPPGGGGGGGIVNFAGVQFPSTIQLEGGKSGLSGTTRITYGAKDGCIGQVFENRKIMENTEEDLSVSTIADTSVCKSMPVVLSRQKYMQGQTYRWSPATNLDNIFSANPIATPEKTTTYCVEVTKDFCTIRKCVTITVKEIPEANAGPDKILCPGEKVTIGTNSVSGNTYLWSPPLYLNNPNLAQPNCTPGKSTKYILTVSNRNGCKTFDTVNVFVTNTTNLISNKDTTVCIGTPLQLLASGAITYEWQPQTGLNNATISNPIATPTVTTKYFVTGINGNCSSRDSITVTVVPKPELTLTSNQMICEGQSIELVAKGADTYMWSPKEGLSNHTIANPIASPKKTTVYHVAGKSGNCIVNDSITIVVKGKPLLIIDDTISICEGENAELSVKGADSYIWMPNAGLSSTTIPNPIARPQSTTTYYVSGTKDGCTANDSITVEVREKPKLVTEQNKYIICSGESIQLTLGIADSYSWFPSDGLSRTDIPNPIATPLATTKYYIKGVKNNCEITDSILITVIQKPILTSLINRTMCEGESVQLEISGAENYEWNPSEGLNRTDIFNPIATPTKTTTYYVIGRKEHCESRDSVLITVKEKPQLSISNDTTLCKGESVQLFAEGAESYEWSPKTYLNNPYIPNPICTPNENIIYSVKGIISDCYVEKSITINTKERIPLPFIISGSDTAKYNPGSEVLLTVTLPSGIDSAKFTIQYDNCCVSFIGIDTSVIQNLTVSSTNDSVTVIVRIPDKSGGKVLPRFKVTLPPDGRLKENFKITNIVYTLPCSVAESINAEINYNPTCAWDIRGVFGSEKFDIVTSGEQAILWTGLGGKTSISIYDMTGQAVWKTENTYPSSSEIEISLPELSGGVYILRAANYVWKKDVVMVR